MWLLRAYVSRSAAAVRQPDSCTVATATPLPVPPGGAEYALRKSAPVRGEAVASGCATRPDVGSAATTYGSRAAGTSGYARPEPSVEAGASAPNSDATVVDGPRTRSDHCAALSTDRPKDRTASAMTSRRFAPGVRAASRRERSARGSPCDTARLCSPVSLVGFSWRTREVIGCEAAAGVNASNAPARETTAHSAAPRRRCMSKGCHDCLKIDVRFGRNDPFGLLGPCCASPCPPRAAAPTCRCSGENGADAALP